MQIHYQSTFEEYAQATKALAARVSKQKRNLLVGRILVISTFVYILAALAFWNHFFPLQSELVVFHLFLPFIAVIILGIALAILIPPLTGKRPSISPRALLAFSIVLVGLIAMVAAAMGLFNSISPHQTRTVFWTWAILPHTTWLALVIMMCFLSIGGQDRQLRANWNDQVTASREKTVEITAACIVISDAVSRCEYSWNAFVGFQETKSLVLLLTSQATGLYFPKRAFNGDEEMNAMRALSELIPKLENAAFPVEPGPKTHTTPPPIPGAST